MRQIKKFSHTTKTLLIPGSLLLFFILLTAFLFGYQKDEKQFVSVSSRLFQQEMTGNTLNMHYTLANPEHFGIYAYEPVLPCYQSENYLASQAATENLLSALSHLKKENLSPKQQYTYMLLTRSLENSLELNRFPYYEEPLSPSSGMQSQLPILFAEYTFREKRDVEDYLALLGQTDWYFASLLTFEQEKKAAGLLMPASSLEKVIEQCDTIVTLEEVENGSHFLQTTFAERLHLLVSQGSLTDREAAAYREEHDRLLKTVVVPAYETLADGLFLLCDDTIPLEGLAAKPEGKEYYRQLLISQTGSYRDISEIKELLLENFSQEYNAIRDILAAHPDAAALLSAQEGAAGFPFEDPKSMLTHLQLCMAEDFPALPEEGKITVYVKSVSPNLESYCAPAFYLTAPIDDTDSNVIYINRKNSPAGLELYTTLAHEGYPGHLYQTVYSNYYMTAEEENPVRQILWYGGYLEGWALYVEFLSYDYAAEACDEAGMEQAAILARLEKHNRGMQLCLYSLLDIMIHYDNASYSQVAELLSHFGIDSPKAVNAVYAYIAEEPCNYLKYYVGYLEILELQKQARAVWGDSYSDYAFHRFYLECGPSDFTSLGERLEYTYAG